LDDAAVETQLKARGLRADAAQAGRVRPGLASLLGRLGAFVDLVPRDVTPPPSGTCA
jgi:hypothetical protein